MAPIDLPGIRIITVSGRIASGSTTLAHNLSKTLGWKHIEGGEVFWEAVRSKLNLSEKDTNLRPDKDDEDFDKSLKYILNTGHHIVLETKLAGFNAQGIDGIFKILVLCKDKDGNDQTQMRIDRLVNREQVSVDAAKDEVLNREKNDLEKWRRLYAKEDPDWTYFNEKYYDLVVNTFLHDKEGTLHSVLPKLGYSVKEKEEK